MTRGRSLNLVYASTKNGGENHQFAVHCEVRKVQGEMRNANENMGKIRNAFLLGHATSSLDMDQ